MRYKFLFLFPVFVFICYRVKINTYGFGSPKMMNLLELLQNIYTSKDDFYIKVLSSPDCAVVKIQKKTPINDDKKMLVLNMLRRLYGSKF